MSFQGVWEALPGGKKEKKLFSKADPLSAIGTKKLDKALFPKRKPQVVPEMPELPPPPVTAVEQGAVGRDVERRRLGRRRSRRATQLARPGGLGPTTVATPGLKTTLG